MCPILCLSVSSSGQYIQIRAPKVSSFCGSSLSLVLIYVRGLCDHSNTVCRCFCHKIHRPILDFSNAYLVEHHSQEFLHPIISIYYPDNDAGLCKDKRAREGLEDGSVLPRGSSPRGTNRGPYFQGQRRSFGIS